jgi:hypothetical protein
MIATQELERDHRQHNQRLDDTCERELLNRCSELGLCVWQAEQLGNRAALDVLLDDGACGTYPLADGPHIGFDLEGSICQRSGARGLG